MRFGTASVVRLERSFRHSLKFLLLTKIVRLNGPLGYVKKAQNFVSPRRFSALQTPFFNLVTTLMTALSNLS